MILLPLSVHCRRITRVTGSNDGMPGGRFSYNLRLRPDRAKTTIDPERFECGRLLDHVIL